MNLRSLFCCLLFPFIILANTETYLLKVPYYFDIPSHHVAENSGKSEFKKLNSTHLLLLNHPIGNKFDPKSNTILTIDYNTFENEEKVILVKLDNYNNNTFTNEDLLYFKLCWPATYPFSFELQHEYLNLESILPINVSTLDLYLVIKLKYDAYTFDEDYLDKSSQVKFQLEITKLPHSFLPIPIELYDTIMYLGDILIVTVQILVPWLLKHLTNY